MTTWPGSSRNPERQHTPPCCCTYLQVFDGVRGVIDGKVVGDAFFMPMHHSSNKTYGDVSGPKCHATVNMTSAHQHLVPLQHTSGLHALFAALPPPPSHLPMHACMQYPMPHPALLPLPCLPCSSCWRYTRRSSCP